MLRIKLADSSQSTVLPSEPSKIPHNYKEVVIRSEHPLDVSAVLKQRNTPDTKFKLIKEIGKKREESGSQSLSSRIDD